MFPMIMAHTSAAQALKPQLDEIVRNLKVDYKIWNNSHTSGLQLVNDMAATFSKCLTIMRTMQESKTERSIKSYNRQLQGWRRQLKKPSEMLMKVVDRMLDATERTRENLKELRNLCATNKDLVECIYYRNWPLRELLDFVESVMPLYDAEYEIKEMVLEELANCKDRQELRFIRKAWREPRHALTREFTEMFKQFEFETVEVKMKK